MRNQQIIFLVLELLTWSSAPLKGATDAAMTKCLLWTSVPVRKHRGDGLLLCHPDVSPFEG